MTPGFNGFFLTKQMTIIYIYAAGGSHDRDLFTKQQRKQCWQYIYLKH